MLKDKDVGLVWRLIKERKERDAKEKKKRQKKPNKKPKQKASSEKDKVPVVVKTLQPEEQAFQTLSECVTVVPTVMSVAQGVVSSGGGKTVPVQLKPSDEVCVPRELPRVGIETVELRKRIIAYRQGQKGGGSTATPALEPKPQTNGESRNWIKEAVYSPSPAKPDVSVRGKCSSVFLDTPKNTPSHTRVSEVEKPVRWKSYTGNVSAKAPPCSVASTVKQCWDLALIYPTICPYPLPDMRPRVEGFAQRIPERVVVAPSVIVRQNGNLSDVHSNVVNGVGPCVVTKEPLPVMGDSVHPFRENVDFVEHSKVGTIVTSVVHQAARVLGPFKEHVPKGPNHPRRQFGNWDRNICDTNFSRVTDKLVSNRRYEVVVYEQVSDRPTSFEERLAFLKRKCSLLLGAQGAFLVYQQLRELLPRVYSIMSLDDECNLWVDGRGITKVPVLSVISGVPKTKGDTFGLEATNALFPKDYLFFGFFRKTGD